MKADKNQHDKRSFHAFDNSNSHGFREIPGDINGDKTRNADLLTYASRFQSISLIPNNWIWEVDVNGVYTYCKPWSIRNLWLFAGRDFRERTFRFSVT